jgi:hypothetical protein
MMTATAPAHMAMTVATFDLIRSGPTLHRGSPSDNNGFALGVFRNQPGYPTNRRDPPTCMAIFAAARYFAM